MTLVKEITSLHRVFLTRSNLGLIHSPLIHNPATQFPSPSHHTQKHAPRLAAGLKLLENTAFGATTFQAPPSGRPDVCGKSVSQKGKEFEDDRQFGQMKWIVFFSGRGVLVKTDYFGEKAGEGQRH